MQNDIQPLALYGSIVGTIALLLNIFGFIHTKRKDTVRLDLECREDGDALENVKRLTETESIPVFDRPSILNVYTVTVINLGHIEAHIQDVWITDSKGEDHNALESNQALLLSKIDKCNISIKPKARHSFKIYLKRGEPLFSPISCHVKDQQNKKWSKRLKLPPLQR